MPCEVSSFTGPGMIGLVCVSHHSCVRLCAAPRTIAHQAPPSRGFSRQEYWSRLPCPPPRELPCPGIELLCLTSPALAGGFFTASATWEDPGMSQLGCEKPAHLPSNFCLLISTSCIQQSLEFQSFLSRVLQSWTMF